MKAKPTEHQDASAGSSGGRSCSHRVLGIGHAVVVASNSDLPSTEDLENPRSDLATAILFSDGSQMGQYYRENRIPVDYDADQSERGERLDRHRGRTLP